MSAKPGDVWESPCGRMTLFCGRWQDVLAHVERVDAVITDPPYSERTHAGQRTGPSTRRPTINYQALAKDAAAKLASWASALSPWWVVVFSDHTASPWHLSAWEKLGWYTFAPVAYVKDVYAPRLSGDGPALGCEWVNIIRQRKRLPPDRAGHRPGWYDARGRYSCDAPAGIAGSKDVGAMQAIVKDYSRPGDLICDPYAGGGTTLLAAAIEGRRAIGAECDPETFEKAVRRLSAGYTPRLFG